MAMAGCASAWAVVPHHPGTGTGTGRTTGTGSRSAPAASSPSCSSSAVARCCSSTSSTRNDCIGDIFLRRYSRPGCCSSSVGWRLSCEDGAISTAAGEGRGWSCSWSGGLLLRVSTNTLRCRQRRGSGRRIFRGKGSCYSSGYDASALRFPRRNRACGVRCSSGEQPSTASVSDEPNITELPCLPFTPSEVFVPSSTKVLHLYEARFLALLEEVIGKYDNLFAHIVIEPISTRGGNDESQGVASFIATYGCLARIEKVKRLEIGAEVSIRGIGRIKLLGLTQLEPFLKGTVISLKDDIPKNAEELGSAIEELRTTLSTVQQLQIKLKLPNEQVSQEELLQTPLERALHWAEKGEQDQVAELYLPSREERVSFAALQPVAGASAAEQHKLLQERLYAMETMDTLQRLKRVGPYAQQTIASLAAKLSIQSLNL